MDKVRDLFDDDQKEPNEVEMTILQCAVEAGISKPQWDLMREALGIEEIEDFLELYSEAYESCHFNPLLNQRVERFQMDLWENFWRAQEESYVEEDSTASGSGDPVPNPSPADPAPPPHAPAAASLNRLCRKHRPSSKDRQVLLKYWLFKAIEHGCQNCVKIMVEEMDVDKSAVSNTNNYTAIEFAVWFSQPEMQEYLEELGFS